MHINATIPAIAFVVLMVVCMLVCYAVAVARGDVQAWIPYISDLGLRGPQHYVFAELIDLAADCGLLMIFLRFVTVGRRTEDVWTGRLNWLSLTVGLLSVLFLSFVGTFIEGQSRGVGVAHDFGAGVVFTGGVVFMVIDMVITLRTRWAEVRDWRSLRWFEWMRPIVAVLSVFAWILSLTGLLLSTNELNAGNATLILPHYWKPDDPGYALHVQGAFCEWLMGLFFVVYALLLLPDFSSFDIHVSLEPAAGNNEVHQPGENDPLLEH